MSTNVRNPADRRQYPERWPRYRGKQLFEVVDDKSETGEEELLSVSHITGITPRSEKKVTMFEAESLVGYKRCRVGDIAANTMWTWQGAIGVSAYDGVVSPAYNVYRQRGDYYNPRFLDLLLREPSLVDVYHSLSTGIRRSRLRLYPNDFLSIDFPVPPMEEQERIVQLIDEKTSSVQQAMISYRKQIDALEELVVVAIAETFGNSVSSADATKPTQFSLLPSIPKRWDFARVKDAYDLTLGKMLASSRESENATYEDYIAARDVHFDGVQITDLKRMWFTENERLRYRVREGDLLIVEGGAVGNSALVHNLGAREIYIQNSIHIARAKRGVAINAFLRYWLMYLSKIGYIASICNVATIAHYTKSKLGATPIPLPPLDEQMQLVSRIDAVYDKVVALIQEKNAAIEKLLALQQKLTADALCGQSGTETRTED